MSPPIPRSRSEVPIATDAPKDRPRRSISFAEGLHPDADRPYSWDTERSPLLGHDGNPRHRERLTALFRGKGKATFPQKRGSEDEASRRARTFLGGISCGLVVALLISSATFIQPIRPGSIIHPPTIPIRHRAHLIHAKHGAVASENESCSIIGVEMLRQGGSAVDAAIAATLCIGVINMFSSGIGGGGFMVIKPPDDTAYTIDFRETAPSAANETMFLKDPLSSMWGGLAVAVPGEIRGLAEAHRRWGKLPWRTVFEPSVKLSTRFRVTKALAERLQVAGMFMIRDPDWAPIFAPNGVMVREGDYISREVYSKTLEAIARDGPDAFYYGPIAESLVAKIQATGGIITMNDWTSYSVTTEPAIAGTYRNRTVYTTHAPTSGPVVLHMLNLLENYELPVEGRTPLNIHRLIEAMKFGFAARSKLCDPRFLNDTTQIDEIPTKKYANLVGRNLTDDSTHPSEYYHPMYDTPEDHGTTHTSVIDIDGMSVSITSTINLIFGSRVLDPRTGVILNNEMDDFSIPGQPNFFGLYPSPYNYPAPRKRPLSSTSPTIITHEDGTPFLIVGGAGGSRIFPSVVQAILNVDWGMDISTAIERARVHDQLFPWVVDVEHTIEAGVVDTLREKGHNVTVSDILLSYATVEGVMRTQDGQITAASDSRKYGVAAGY